MVLDASTVILGLLALLQVITIPILGWALLQIIRYGQEIEVLKKGEIGVQGQLKEIKMEITSIKHMLTEALLHRRKTDDNGDMN